MDPKGNPMLTSSRRRRTRRTRVLASLGTAASVAVALSLTAGLSGCSTSSAEAETAPATATHSTATHAAAATTAAATAKKNTNPIDAPAYRPAAVQKVVWDMTEVEREIAPGKVVKLWTFQNRVPGPVVRVRVGDMVEVTIRNKGTLPHSVDFHAARIAPNRAFRDVKPGESFTFKFRATTPGVFMYHCGTAPVVHHIANGMYGMIIVEPEGGLPAVDRELAIVQSDFYTSDTPGNPTPDDKLMTGIPDVMAFNGYAAQYKTNPVKVKRGEKIRVFLLAAGPNEWSAFHVVGTIFDKAWIDGIHPENLALGNQTLNLSASQGAVAEFSLDEEGVYPFVTHDFTNATKGAIGLFATENATVTGGGH
jgi:nitrite reductase (NO-forming)